MGGGRRVLSFYQYTETDKYPIQVWVSFSKFNTPLSTIFGRLRKDFTCVERNSMNSCLAHLRLSLRHQIMGILYFRRTPFTLNFQRALSVKRYFGMDFEALRAACTQLPGSIAKESTCWVDQTFSSAPSLCLFITLVLLQEAKNFQPSGSCYDLITRFPNSANRPAMSRTRT